MAKKITMQVREYVELLRQGSQMWNQWARDNRGIAPDLYEADLSGLDLSNVELLSGDLRRANLRGTNLSGATLSHCNFICADLSFANLSRTGLVDANIYRSKLKGADFTESLVVSSRFIDIDLSESNGLETARVYGPSTVGVDTIFNSRGKIPEGFLRGCGLPESLIVNIPALVSSLEPIQFYSCFISYSSKDQAFTERLYADLQNKGIRCWYAPEKLRIGERIRIGIDESIQMHDKLLLVLSRNSVGSVWVEKEVETAMEKERKQKRTVLFPIRLDDAVMRIEIGWPADIRRTRNIGDFKKWENHDSYQAAFDRLLRDLKAV